MRRVLAIASLAVRNAVRSRVFALLFVLLIAAILLLPLSVKGDGTLAGRLQVLIRYSLGLSSFILALSTLWTGCAAVSQEIETRQIHLLVAKPVRRAEIWTGKWLGLMALNTVLVAVCACVVYANLRWLAPRMHVDAAASWPDIQRTLQSKRVVAPPPLDVEDAAHDRLRELQAAGALPSGMSPSSALDVLRRDLRARANTIAAGASLHWILPVPEAKGSGEVLLRYRFQTSRIGLEPMALRWTVSGAGGTPYVATVTNSPHVTHELNIPAKALGQGREVAVDLVNLQTEPVTVLLSPDDGVTLLLPEDGFGLNLLRASLILLARLALLAAIGLTAGSLFSLPVAGLVALMAVVLIQFNPYVQSLSENDILLPWHDAAQGARWSDHALRMVFRAVGVAMAPLRQRDVLGALAAGELIAWGEVGQALATYALLFGGLVAVLGSSLLNRRELGLPET